ncbi:MAG: hypothetical protein ACFE9Z_12905 [Promethearchaeota archaeon]
MDWNNFLENIGLWFNEFIDWYSMQPIYAQVLVIIGIIALLALAITLTYYIIKGIAYLVYYIIKGVYYILKGIGYGFLKLCEGFYNLISGKSNIKLQTNTPNNIHNQIEFCSECGKKVTNKMKKHLETNGVVFCVSCGNQFTRYHTTQPITISH